VKLFFLPCGSIIPQVKITLRNVDTTVEHVAQSNNAGNYVFLSITPGQYTLPAEAPGFELSKTAPFTLEVNQTATFDLTMQVGTVQQTLTVGRGSHTPARHRNRVLHAGTLQTAGAALHQSQAISGS